MSAAVVSSLLMDPFFLSMESGTVRWADLLIDDGLSSGKMAAGKAGSATLAPIVEEDDRIVKWWTESYKIDERTQDWEVPNLTLRKDIETYFPVRLESMPAAEDSHAERFRIVFDTMRLEECRAYADSHDEYEDYAEWVQTRLVFALNQYKHKYIIESVGAYDADYVVIISMAHSSARRYRAAIPTLLGFPVTWTQDPSDHTRHLIKPHLKRIRDSGVAPEKIANDLLDALQQCADCTLESPEPESPYILIVKIPSAAPPAPEPAPVAPASALRVAAAAVAVAAATTPRALDVMRANRLAWDREGRKHFIKHRTREQEARILDELAACSDCTIERTPTNLVYMCVLTLL